MLLGCVLLTVYFLTGLSLKAYTLYTVYILLYISVFQIRKHSYIDYDNPVLGIQIVRSRALKKEGFLLVLFSLRLPQYPNVWHRLP